MLSVVGRPPKMPPTSVCCNSDTPCPNVCHVTCLSDHETYTCTDTQQLRLEGNIDDAVMYLYDNAHADNREDNPTTETHPTTLPEDDDNDDNETEDERQLYMEMEKEELVTHILRFKQEESRNSNKIQSLTLQRDWILD